MCEYNFEEIKSDNIYQYIFNAGNLGVCKWNINKNEMFIYEKITEYELNPIKNMIDFINIIAYEKDRMIAIKDLDDYINGYFKFYQSTFRIKTKSGETKWILLKGKIFKDEAENCSVLYVLIFNVTNKRLFEGHDNLTNLPNREFFLKKLNYSINIAKANNKKGALIFIDIDNFKILNNNYGSYIGDLILKMFAQSISDLICSYGELARLQGDEFIILIHEFNDEKEIKEVCRKIHEYLKQPFKIMDNEIYINVSLGITIFPNDSSNDDELLKFCNYAVYESKHNGKNACTFFDKQNADSYFRKSMIKSELENSIINNELDVFYQPQIDALNNKIIGAEALLRWNNNILGNVSPTEFIPIAEKNGYIVKIGNWVLDKALNTACMWKQKGYKFNTISVNVSPIQLKRNNFKENILNTCAKYNVSPDLLEIEITEGTLIEVCKDKVEVLNELIESGVKIAIDDFGMGYSSLNYLLKLPITTLKIDKSIIDNVENYKNKAVINGIVCISKSLKYKIITEGVETRKQLDALLKLGCNIIQGYYFSKPIAEKSIENLLKSQC